MAITVLVNGAGNCQYFCLSTDAKPVAVSGYSLREIDTGRQYFAVGGLWVRNVIGRAISMVKTLVNLNSLNSDVATWTSVDRLPTKYRIESLMAYDVSINVAAAVKIALYSGPLGTGTSFVNSVGVAINTDETKDFNITAAGSKIITAPILYLRNTGVSGTATCSFMLGITDLS